jgi:hypothetical protein
MSTSARQRFTIGAPGGAVAAVILSMFVLRTLPRSFALPSVPEPVAVNIQWDKVTGVSKATPTLQVVVNPPLERGSTIHDRVFDALGSLGADDVRYVPWLPYPRLAVAELEPPQAGKTFWDFSLLDPMMDDLMRATAGHSVIINFSTIPQWMFKSPKPVPYPSDPNQVTWDYEQGTDLRDPSMKEVAEYYGRLASWYTRGGFTDEAGRLHSSGHHYKIGYWEVLNEVDFEHDMSPEFYTALYDAVTESIHRVDPTIKFVGLALAAPGRSPQFFEYFLDPRHHKPGTPIDMISYHFYASPADDEPAEAWPYTFFDQASRFVDLVRYIQAIRARLSPQTATDTDELGAILPNDNATPRGPIPDSYWNLCSAMYAYLYSELAQIGVEVVGESQLVGYPSQFPSVSMVNWNTGRPNARFWTLKLLHDNLGAGDRLVHSEAGGSLYAQGFVAPGGKRLVLLLNERDRVLKARVPGAAGASEQYVDQTTGEHPAASTTLSGDTITLGGFAVALVTIKS